MAIYSALNREVVSRIIKKIFLKSEEGQLEESNKINDFYYEKFSLCDHDELKQVLMNRNKYPVEAQKALRKLEMERKNM